MGNDEMDFVNNHQSSAIDGFTEEWITMRKLITLKVAFCTIGAWSAAVAILCGTGTFLSTAIAQSGPTVSSQPTVEQGRIADKKATKEPVFRVSKLSREKSPAGLDSDYGVAEVVTNPSLQTPKMSAAIAPTPSTTAEASKATATPFRTASSKTFTIPTSVTDLSIPLAAHPLDRAISIAQEELVKIRSSVRDYSAIMVKRERINGVLGGPEYMQMKVRCPRTVSGKNVPFSVYLKTLKPKKSAGREVVWTQGQNDNKLCAHETGLLGMKRFYLDPTGWIAMQNNRYPIHDAGIENLIMKLIDKAKSAKAAGKCTVNYRDNAEIMKRKCSLIELINEEHRECDEFHKAHVFIDNELNLPVRYVAFDWPMTPGGKSEIIEEYTYVRINLNQGFRDIDFSPENPAYKFPRR